MAQLEISIAAGLSYADSMSLRVLLLAARTLKERGGALVLLRPQQPVARMLDLLDADQMIMIGADAEVPPETGSAAQDNPELTRPAHHVPRSRVHDRHTGKGAPVPSPRTEDRAMN